MRSIAKGSEPESLRSFRAGGGRYGDFPEAPKQKLRESLVAEQRGLCCYCMSSISASSSAMSDHSTVGISLLVMRENCQ